MARLPLIHGKDRLAPRLHRIAEAITDSCGAPELPYTVLLNYTDLATPPAHLGSYLRSRIAEADTLPDRLGDHGFVQPTDAIGYYGLLAMTVNAKALEFSPHTDLL